MQAENIAPIKDYSEMQVQYGIIHAVVAARYQILGQSGSYVATPAFSCLVEPIPGDRVLFSIGSNGQCHVISIIERAGSTDTRLEFPGDVTLAAPQGQLHLNGQQGIDMSSPQKISQVAGEFSLVAKTALLSVERISAVGRALTTQIGNIQTIADTVQTIAGNLLQKLNNSIRSIEGVDQTRAGDVISTVKNLYSLHSKQAAILARKDIKMDAERIHMG